MEFNKLEFDRKLTEYQISKLLGSPDLRTDK